MPKYLKYLPAVIAACALATFIIGTRYMAEANTASIGNHEKLVNQQIQAMSEDIGEIKEDVRETRNDVKELLKRSE